VLEVFQLARLSLAKAGEELTLDIVPLFETIDDLAEAPSIMEQLYLNPIYRNHLSKRKSKQTIMLGFSDGTKDGGYIRANWSILQAKEELTRMSRKYDVNVVFFDGRGGPPGRGGGNTHDFYASLGSEIENVEIERMTFAISNRAKHALLRSHRDRIVRAYIQNDPDEGKGTPRLALAPFLL
jgi:phosphoenolpyruvate carboxylase